MDDYIVKKWSKNGIMLLTIFFPLKRRQEMNFTKENVSDILDALIKEYPDAGCALIHEDVYQLLVKVTLSAQTTDVSVNRISDRLFGRYPDAFAMAKADVSELEEILKTIGMYKTKSRRLVEQAKVLVESYHGQVPDSDEALQTLPGVGRKTANVVMSVGFGHQRIAVDTHVFRLANRIGLVEEKDVLGTELALMKILPEDRWSEAHHSLIFHGRNCCMARNPKCVECVIAPWCRKVGL